MSDHIHQVIENSHLFSGLDRKLIGRIAATATIKSLSENELLFQKGDPADALWGVLSGRVVIQMCSDDGKEMVLEAFEAGDVFGEVGVLDFGPRHVTATAEIPSKLFRLERKHFLEHLQSSSELCFRVFSLLCSQLRNTTETLEDTALYKLPKRLAKKLTSLSDANGNYGDDGQPILHVMQMDLAKMLGVNREAVNRNLREWEKRGWVSLKHQQIEIHERKSLADLAAPSQVADQKNWGFDGIGLLPPAAFPAKVGPASKTAKEDRRTVSILAMDAAKYSSLLMADTAGTLKRLREGLTAVDKSISRYGGQLIWHAGDRILAEFSDASAAMQVALAIQASDKGTGTDEPDQLFRIGIHVGELVVSGNHYLGEAINVAINLTTLATTGGILVSGQARAALGDSASLDLPFLGNHEFKNVSGEVSVYSARAVPVLRSLYLRLDALIPRRMRPLYLGVALILAVSITWLATDRIGRALFPSPVPVNSIAVLPFEALGHCEGLFLCFSPPGIRGRQRRISHCQKGVCLSKIGIQGNSLLRQMDRFKAGFMHSILRQMAGLQIQGMGIGVLAQDNGNSEFFAVKGPAVDGSTGAIQNIPLHIHQVLERTIVDCLPHILAGLDIDKSRLHMNLAPRRACLSHQQIGYAQGLPYFL